MALAPAPSSAQDCQWAVLRNWHLCAVIGAGIFASRSEALRHHSLAQGRLPDSGAHVRRPGGARGGARRAQALPLALAQVVALEAVVFTQAVISSARYCQVSELTLVGLALALMLRRPEVLRLLVSQGSVPRSTAGIFAP